ncbi:hypothetical protein BOTCAL_0505g00030 [Botryotinia calthae]|uniref:Uncharacterized protein n=1 Tax=Botryotinia calthae TaxID=38488 RepID=A0A4Y8CM00_9HELO|nr:hypothetical protein BOTCAL_0505g00030 [Botryotinia calthae]
MGIARYIFQYLGLWQWRETWLRTENDRNYLAPDIQNAEWKNGNDLGTTIYYASLFKLKHVERILADEHNTTVDVPLQLGECPPLSVAIHFENASHVHHFIRTREGGYTEYESCRITLELAIEKIERAGALGLAGTNMFQDIMWEVLERRDEVVLKLLLDLGMHPDLPYCDLWYCRTGSTKSPLQQAVYKRWRAGISLLLKRRANVNYLDASDISITSFTCFGPLEILRRGIKDPDIPPGSDDDSSGNDRLIEEQNVSSDGSTDGRVSEGSEIEIDEDIIEVAEIMVDNKCED